jgi:hypothetical protein
MAPGLRVDLGPLGLALVHRDGAAVRVLTLDGDPAPAAVELAALAILAARYLDDLAPARVWSDSSARVH